MGDEWWEFEEETKRVRRELKRGEGDRKAYRAEKVSYKWMLEKKKEKNEKWEKEMQRIRTERQV